ncbi:thioredoxin domain-containing protein [Maribacter algarum]|uniref:Thioredoxin domain-containing protein n=1 Tax=Maribacter algarum (ex Zhang et al. 2020) TaxID=2578118 RepID=A0A5S3QK95_9FLAO|nr:thioredoxin domain-containing protein [Maribacter algarum]TMM58244.1 thioredoxin domain-containing protein [Maribacter algarum]
MTHKYTNALINETSPYLLQHAHNPVNWEAWNPEVLERAKKENKLLLISIGYAACHWCHVMEHECFEDDEAATVMNANFINIKIDREERPDVDHVYMDALQMMTGSGGWPLNIVALPDGRPFWGATYVKKKDWISILNQLSETYKNSPQKVEEYAQNLANGIKAINLVENQNELHLFTAEQLDDAVKDWSRYFDTFLGGYKRAPKFMMPVNLNFLLHYGTARKNEKVLEYTHTTLTKMAWGGIFDHVGGGFSRYSVDTKWHVPHFEKMLYDNGQLVSLYAKAYAATKNDLYKTTVEQTIAFVEKELMHHTFGFYSSLDADSFTETGELEEGAYYVWQEEELKKFLGDNFGIFKDYFNINGYGHWEHGNYVLIRDASDKKIARKHSINTDDLKGIINSSLAILDAERSKRNRPRLDDKILTSWNGLMLNGLVDAYRYLGNDSYLELALKNASFILENLVKPDGGLWHNHKNGKSTINGYLEDYASIIEAFIGLYEVTFDEQWLTHANILTAYCQKNFFDAESGMFFFTSKQDDYVIRRTIETSDNVVPASNSIMAKNLFRLSKLFPEKSYEETALQLLKNVQHNFDKNAQNHANWLELLLFFDQPYYEIAIVGENHKEKAKEIAGYYLSNTIMAATEKESTLSILQNRHSPENTFIYICEQGACKLPVPTVNEALELLRN